jgi:hypothetical protein
MCFDAKTSISTFCFSVISSYILIKRSPTSDLPNTALIGYFMRYVAIVQLLEYGMWIDLPGSRGYNQLASQIMPFLIYLQPSLICWLGEQKLSTITPEQQNRPDRHQTTFRKIWQTVNVVYAAYAIFHVSQVFVRNKDTSAQQPPHCAKVGKDGHLNWNGMFGGSPIRYLYYGMFIVNTLYYLDNPFGKLFAILIIFSSYLSFSGFGYSWPEMWCYFGAILPIIVLLFSLGYQQFKNKFKM